jgi:mono/diheme cytochrome c family protein
MRKGLAIGVMSASLAMWVTAAALLSAKGSRAQAPKAAKDSAAAHAGQDLFTQKCILCHSVNEGQVMFGPSLYQVMKKPVGKKSAAEIRTILQDGKGKMPPFKDKLTPEDVNNLLAYLHTL